MSENKLRKFKLIDEEGYKDYASINATLLEIYLKDNCFEGFMDDSCLTLGSKDLRDALITRSEFQFFEEVFKEELSQEENTFPQIGDQAKFSGSNKHYEVVGVHGSKCMILSEKGDYILADVTEVVQYVPLTEDEITTRREVKSLIQRYTLDTALDYLMEEYTVVKKEK